MLVSEVVDAYVCAAASAAGTASFGYYAGKLNAL
jgi:hypothetical protein